MSFEAREMGSAPARRVWPRAGGLAALWNYRLGEEHAKLAMVIVASLFAAYVVMCVKTVAIESRTYKFGDFQALWTSAVVAHDGQPALNYDADALHSRQIELGESADRDNPFPYPPTFLLALQPLGGFSLSIAFLLFMIPGLLGYLWAMVGGRARDWRWWLGALIAPASGITVISCQSGFLTGALMVGGLRLAATRPILSGVLFGLLAFKPQIGLLVPIALLAAGLWRTIAAATATLLLCALATTLAYGVHIWPIWIASMSEYAVRFYPVIYYMPTIYANAVMLDAPRSWALASQVLVAIPVAAIVWRAFRAGPTPRASALLLAGTFLATPHAFNYDMPMLTAALLWYPLARFDGGKSLTIGELVTLILAFVLPFAMLPLRNIGAPVSWLPEGLLFALFARAPEPLAAADEAVGASVPPCRRSPSAQTLEFRRKAS